VNEVSDIFDEEGRPDAHRIDYRDRFLKRGLHRSFWRKITDLIQNDFLNVFDPIGHGTVLSYPDLPYLKWKYKDFQGHIIHRSNPQIFIEGTEHLYKFLQEYKTKHNIWNNSSTERLKNLSKDFDRICRNTEDFISEEPSERLNMWKESVLRGDFSFGTDVWNYEIEGKNSWLYEAFGYESNDDFEFKNVKFDSNFMSSNWKMAQDALSFHQFSVLHEILPKFGICAA
jgi:hypothetical protein